MRSISCQVLYNICYIEGVLCHARCSVGVTELMVYVSVYVHVPATRLGR